MYNAGQTNKHVVMLLCIKAEVPALFCSGGTEPGDSVWKIPAWDWGLRQGMMEDCHWPVNLHRDRGSIINVKLQESWIDRCVFIYI